MAQNMFQVYPVIHAYSVYNPQSLIRNAVATETTTENVLFSFLRNDDIVLTFLC